LLINLYRQVGPNNAIDPLKAHLAAISYTQIFGLHYCDTFSLVAKMALIKLLLAMAAF